MEDLGDFDVDVLVGYYWYSVEFGVGVVVFIWYYNGLVVVLVDHVWIFRLVDDLFV